MTKRVITLNYKAMIKEKLTRKEEIAKAAIDFASKTYPQNPYNDLYDAFWAGAVWADRHQIGVLDEDYALEIYNFINRWKNGEFGIKPLQVVLKEHNF